MKRCEPGRRIVERSISRSIELPGVTTGDENRD
jgi:hypothetical protein